MKPLIKVTLLNNSSIAVFTQHIASIENSPRGCIIHMVNGQAIESKLSPKEILDAIGYEALSTTRV